MNVGIKYCGGCNCRYNRTQAVNNFIKNHPHYTYIYDPETQYCDICLVICGCPTACPEVTALLTKQVKFITSPHQLNTLDLSIDSLEKKTSSHKHSSFLTSNVYTILPTYMETTTRLSLF